MLKHYQALTTSEDFSRLYNAFGLEVAIAVASFDVAVRVKKLKQKHLGAKSTFTLELMEFLGLKTEHYRYWVAFVRYRTARDVHETLRTVENKFVDDLKHYFVLDVADPVDLTLATEVRMEIDE